MSETLFDTKLDTSNLNTGTFYDHISALKDYEEALKLDPRNESLKADAERIRNIIQGT
jgi:hypothetical protein